MVRKDQFSPRFIARKRMPLAVAFCWFAGLLCGVACCAVSSAEIVTLMHRAVSCPASIVGLLNAAMIPFLLSAVFMAFAKPWIIAGICFVKAFLYSFVSIGILMSFGSGGWLLRYLLLFSDCTALPFLVWYWSRPASVPVWPHRIAAGAVLLLIFAAVTALDYRIIATMVCLIDSTKG